MITATVISDSLHLREKADDKSKWIDKLTKGDKLQLHQISIMGNWLHVKVLATKSGQGVGQRGWVHKDFVLIENGPPDVEPTEPKAPPPYVEQDSTVERLHLLAAVGVIAVVVAVLYYTLWS